MQSFYFLVKFGLVLIYILKVYRKKSFLIQGFLDASIPVWAPKLRTQIKAKPMQENVSHLRRCSTQLLLYTYTFNLKLLSALFIYSTKRKQLQIMKNAFYFTKKALFVLKISNFCASLFLSFLPVRRKFSVPVIAEFTREAD